MKVRYLKDDSETSMRADRRNASVVGTLFDLLKDDSHTSTRSNRQNASDEERGFFSPIAPVHNMCGSFHSLTSWEKRQLSRITSLHIVNSHIRDFFFPKNYVLLCKEGVAPVTPLMISSRELALLL